MAFTASIIAKGIAMGNQNQVVLNVTADAAAGNVATGLSKILYAQVTSKSAATNPNVMENSGESGTSIAGTIALSNCTSGNIYRVVVHGS
jgi:acetylglutamate kinase